MTSFTFITKGCANCHPGGGPMEFDRDGKAVDLVYDDVRPLYGVIAIRFWNRHSGNAMFQAIEVVPNAVSSSPRGITEALKTRPD